MKNTFSRMAAVALTIWLGLAAGAANASVMTFNGWSSVGGGYAGGFSNSFGTTFNDWLDFSLPGGSSGNGASNVISLAFGAPVTLSKFELWDIASSSLISSGSIGGFASSLSFSNAAVPGAYELRLAGSSSSSGIYSGNIVISPVPEPETYAMLLAGLGLIGVTTRRRKQNF